MSADIPVTKKPIVVRTFAGDLEATRAKKGGVSKTQSTTVSTVAPTLSTPPPVASPKVASGEKAKLVFTQPKTITAAPVKKPEPSKPATSDVPQTKAKTSIPPFHTFQKPAANKKPETHPDGPEITTLDTSHVSGRVVSSQASILTGVGKSRDLAIGDDADTNTATIITDTKRNRFSLTKALGESMSSWYEDKKDTLTGKKKPKYTVPQADRRKGVIQKATSQTGRTSTADHAEVLKRLRANKQTTGVVPITKPKPIPTEPVWGGEVKEEPANKVLVTEMPTRPVAPIPTALEVPKSTSPGFTEPPVVEPVIVPVVKPPVPVVAKTPVFEVPKPVIPVVPAIAPVTPPRIIPTPVIPVITQTVAPSVQPEVAPPPVIAEPPAAKPITPTIPKMVPPRKRTISDRPVFRLREMINHTNRIMLFGGVIIGTIIFGGISYPFILEQFTATPAVTVTTENLFTSTVVTTLPVPATSKAAVLSAIKNAATTPDSLTEVILTNPQTGNRLTAAELFTLFSISVPAAFESSITDVSLGVYRGDPWLSLTTSDASTAQGGMLDWENRMSADLEPWYGEAVRSTKKSGITAFTDKLLDGRDVRVLQDAANTERITYGFVTSNHLLITTNTTAWLNLKQQWRTAN